MSSTCSSQKHGNKWNIRIYTVHWFEMCEILWSTYVCQIIRFHTQWESLKQSIICILESVNQNNFILVFFTVDIFLCFSLRQNVIYYNSRRRLSHTIIVVNYNPMAWFEKSNMTTCVCCVCWNLSSGYCQIVDDSWIWIWIQLQMIAVLHLQYSLVVCV